MTRTTKYFGFSRTRKIIVAFVALFAAVMLIVPTTGIHAYAEDTRVKDFNTILFPYIQELEKINDELGTEYFFELDESLSEDELYEAIDFYQQMTLEEFRNHMYEAYENEKDINLQTNSEIFYVENTFVDAEILSTNPTTTLTQKFYYDGVLNYLYIVSTVMYGDGRAIYSSVDNSGYQIIEYPGYKAYATTDVFYSSDRSSVRCLFYCYKYSSRLVRADDLKYRISVVFEAAAGDVYEGGISV